MHRTDEKFIETIKRIGVDFAEDAVIVTGQIGSNLKTVVILGEIHSLMKERYDLLKQRLESEVCSSDDIDIYFELPFQVQSELTRDVMAPLNSPLYSVFSSLVPRGTLGQRCRVHAGDARSHLYGGASYLTIIRMHAHFILLQDVLTDETVQQAARHASAFYASLLQGLDILSSPFDPRRVGAKKAFSIFTKGIDKLGTSVSPNIQSKLISALEHAKSHARIEFQELIVYASQMRDFVETLWKIDIELSHSEQHGDESVDERRLRELARIKEMTNLEKYQVVLDNVTGILMPFADLYIVIRILKPSAHAQSLILIGNDHVERISALFTEITGFHSRRLPLPKSAAGTPESQSRQEERSRSRTEERSRSRTEERSRSRTEERSQSQTEERSRIRKKKRSQKRR